MSNEYVYVAACGAFKWFRLNTGLSALAADRPASAHAQKLSRQSSKVTCSKQKHMIKQENSAKL